MIIRQAIYSDISAIIVLLEEARTTIAALGIDQWQNGYPDEPIIREDIAYGRCHVIEQDGRIVATFALIDDGEPTYDRIYEGAWLTGDQPSRVLPCPYIAIHRVAIALRSRGQGLAGQIMSHADEYARTHGCRSLRIDTHPGNVVMRRMLQKQSFAYCGRIVLASGDDRVAYEKVLL